MTIEKLTDDGEVTVELARPWHPVPSQASRRAGAHPALPPRASVAPGHGRRTVDVAVAVVALVALGPLLAVLMVAVRLGSPGPAMFRQVRVGQGGRLFTLYKLRSMRTGVRGPEFTTGTDPRVTRLGWVLRRTSLDEVPQFWNVLRGDMTLVGARPETPALAAGYPPHCRWVFDHRPGLTGPAQVRMRDIDVLAGDESVEAYLSRIVPARSAIEAAYLREPTLRATFGVLADTVRHLAGRPLPVR